MTFYIYILQSTSSNIFYIGSTSNFKNRLISHNNSDENTFTSKHRPWVFAAVFEAGTSRIEAQRIVRFIKQQKSKLFIEKIIDPNFIPSGKLAQLVRVPKLRD
ncbi:MAG TPA: GIY-YIG nuclease family protein [Vicingus sp.]|nr:GIY-YIG nuclease family protein [Vicingus sp.]HRP61148.1 GIY-YIG nuclease family protein [Vicingus sp.]